MSLFKHNTEAGDHGLHLPEKLKHFGHQVSDIGHTVTDTVLHPHIAETLREMGHQANVSMHAPNTRCRACHAELSPEDISLGCCSDHEACGCRAYSARCF